MSNARFESALAFTLSQEGGVSNDVGDSGGLTNLGITYREWVAYCKQQKKPVSTPEQFSKYLTIQDVRPIYLKNYWNACKCDSIPYPLDVCVFDAAVNLGTDWAVKTLQVIVGTHADGEVGPNTISALEGSPSGLLTINYNKRRVMKYREITLHKPVMKKFLNGWLNRVNALSDAIIDGKF